MFNIGWFEMAVIALVALIVFGPKELPKAMRLLAFWIRKSRRMADEFRRGIDQIVREAELEEARDAIRAAGQMDIDKAIEEAVEPAPEAARVTSAPAELGAAAEPPRAPSTDDTSAQSPPQRKV
jgi:sec-independent protein translocase protein TatB